MTALVSPPREISALGGRVAGLTPGTRSSLRTGALAAALLAPAAMVLSVVHRPWGMTLLAIVLGGLGLVLASVAVIELLPTPGRLVFHEHGFADVRPDHTIDLYLDGSAVVHTVPSENLPQSARAMGTTSRSSIATR